MLTPRLVNPITVTLSSSQPGSLQQSISSSSVQPRTITRTYQKAWQPDPADSALMTVDTTGIDGGDNLFKLRGWQV